MNEKLCRRLVADRSEGFCERCCRGGQTTMHHRKKRGQGGLWTCENIVAVCGDGTRGCHGWIESHPLLAAEYGWHVQSWAVPAEVLLKWRGSTWVYLTPEGTIENVD